MGYPELLQVIGEEAAREAREAREAGGRECARILEEAHAAAKAARQALVSRARAEGEARLEAARARRAEDRERALLVERRRHLEDLRARCLAALADRAGPELDARLLAEALPEAPEGPLAVFVDPGAEEACRTALARLDPAAASRAEVRGAGARRGGIEIVAGRLVLDDTLPSRLERLWPSAESELAAILFEEEEGKQPERS